MIQQQQVLDVLMEAQLDFIFQKVMDQEQTKLSYFSKEVDGAMGQIKNQSPKTATTVRSQIQDQHHRQFKILGKVKPTRTGGFQDQCNTMSISTIGTGTSLFIATERGTKAIQRSQSQS